MATKKKASRAGRGKRRPELFELVASMHVFELPGRRVRMTATSGRGPDAIGVVVETHRDVAVQTWAGIVAIGNRLTAEAALDAPGAAARGKRAPK